MGELTITRARLEQLTIRTKSLDPIRVITEDIGPGQGSIAVTCYGRAWTTYWGGMGNKNVVAFFKTCDTHYLVGCLVRGMTPGLKRHKADDGHYLGRIVEAVRAAFAQENVEVANG